jgi:solute carrier family 25 2-oxodicarboxylate transporter 21
MFCSGLVGGVTGTCFNCPLDVVKSRIQTQAVVPGVTQKYTRVLPSLQTIAKEEGWRALYKGFAPKCIRMGLGGGVAMSVFDTSLAWLGAREEADR